LVSMIRSNSRSTSARRPGHQDDQPAGLGDLEHRRALTE
jgi:hypothetical protein